MSEEDTEEQEESLDKAKALLDAFDTVEDTGHTSRSGTDSREAPISAPKRPQAREAPTVGLARKTEGITAHEAGVEAVRDAPVNVGTNLVHEAPKNLAYAKADENPSPPPSSTDTGSVPLPPSIPLPKKDDED
ncbi:MAG: hypothetical protein QF707_00615 [Candidatus Poseidoniaceae archaeon]|jgi:hypothetical protein|nr:hypothetical protein [Candidatus Poseidoniaceae archaeon]